MILFVLSCVSLAVWVVIATMRVKVFRAPPRLAAAPQPADWPEVVAVIPARDEAATIGAVIRAHAGSTYRGRLSVMLVDDHSSDATRSEAESATASGLLTIVEAPPLAPGWTGKLAAVNAGLAAAAERAPDARYLLLTDADIVLAPQTLASLVAAAEDNDLALTSLMARLDARGFWGGLLIPAFVYFFQKLYPFDAANDPATSVAAAAGGCMLVRREALDAIGGVASIRGRLIDDCALADAIKKSGRKIWIGIAKNEAVSLRDNRRLSSIWSMVARTAFTQLHHSWLLLAGTLFGMALLYGAPPLIALALPVHGDGVAAAIAAASWALMALTYRPTARHYEQPASMTFLLPVAALFYMLMTLSSAIDHARGEGGRWKGRTYAA